MSDGRSKAEPPIVKAAGGGLPTQTIPQILRNIGPCILVKTKIFLNDAICSRKDGMLRSAECQSKGNEGEGRKNHPIQPVEHSENPGGQDFEGMAFPTPPFYYSSWVFSLNLQIRVCFALFALFWALLLVEKRAKKKI